MHIEPEPFYLEGLDEVIPKIHELLKSEPSEQQSLETEEKEKKLLEYMCLQQRRITIQYRIKNSCLKTKATETSKASLRGSLRVRLHLILRCAHSENLTFIGFQDTSSNA